MRAREGAPTRVAVRMGMGMVSLQGQSLSRASRRVVVAVVMTVVVVSAWAIAVLRWAVTRPSSATTGGMLGQAAADMVPFHMHRGVVGRPGRKGALWA